MMFVDGENLTIRAQAVAKSRGVPLSTGRYYLPDTFIWQPGITGVQKPFGHGPVHLEPFAVRAHYYTSIVGDDDRLLAVRESLRAIDFSPEVFKKPRGTEKAKGVDIALAKDLLTHANFGNYDVAILVAGDGDYLPLVQEIKRLGRVAYVMFLKESGLSTDLRLAADLFFPMDDSSSRRGASSRHERAVEQRDAADEAGTTELRS
jgi:hypothetical protein